MITLQRGNNKHFTQSNSESFSSNHCKRKKKRIVETRCFMEGSLECHEKNRQTQRLLVFFLTISIRILVIRPFYNHNLWKRLMVCTKKNKSVFYLWVVWHTWIVFSLYISILKTYCERQFDDFCRLTEKEEWHLVGR